MEKPTARRKSRKMEVSRGCEASSENRCEKPREARLATVSDARNQATEVTKRANCSRRSERRAVVESSGCNGNDSSGFECRSRTVVREL
jgi:hypothetical protein